MLTTIGWLLIIFSWIYKHYSHENDGSRMIFSYMNGAALVCFLVSLFTALN